jgi:hypothetical protein
VEKGKSCELRDSFKRIANLEAGNPPLVLTCSTLVADVQEIVAS